MPSYDDATRALLAAPNFAHLSTLREDGSVHNVVVWIDIDDEGLFANTAVGRVWPTNLERDPRVTISVHDQDKPYEYVTIRGTVASSTTDGADDVIDALAKKYMDVDAYPFRQEGEQRITYRFTPEKVSHHGA